MSLRRLRLALVTGILLTSPAASPAAASADPASSSSGWQVDAEHSGYLYGAGVMPPLTSVWTDHLDALPYSLSIGGGHVYAVVDVPTTHNNYIADLEAIDLATGAVVWSQTINGLPAPFSYTNVTGDEVVVAYTWDGPNGGALRLSAFSQSSGQQLWSTIVNDQSDATPPVIHNGVLYLEGWGVGGNVYAFNAATGAPLWESAQLVSGFPVVWAGDALVMGTECPFAIGLNPADGSVLWPGKDNCDAGGTPMASFDGTHVWTDESWFGKSGYVYDPTTGAQTGTFTGDAPAFGYGEAVQNEDNYSGATNSVIRAFDPTTMATLWTFSEPAYKWPETGYYYQGSQPLLADGSVFALGPGGQVWALSPCTGAVRWQSQVDPSPGGPEPLDSLAAGDGYLVVPSSGGLTGFKGSGTPAAVPDCRPASGSGSASGSAQSSGSGSGAGTGSGSGTAPGTGLPTVPATAGAPVLPAADTQPAQRRAEISLRLLASRCSRHLGRRIRTTCRLRLRAGVGGRLTVRVTLHRRTLAARVLELRGPRQLRLTLSIPDRSRLRGLRLLVSLRAGDGSSSVTRRLRVAS